MNTTEIYLEKMMELFFYYIKERYSIYEAKLQGFSYPYSNDDILNKYHFSNIHRKKDTLTIYIQNLLSTIESNKDKIYCATICRWFNNIHMLKALVENKLHIQWNESLLLDILREREKEGLQIFPSTHMVMTSPHEVYKGSSKIGSLCQFISVFVERHNRLYKDSNIHMVPSIKNYHEYLMKNRGLNKGFIAYEIAIDCVDSIYGYADDNMTYSFFGKGSIRGMYRLTGTEFVYGQVTKDNLTTTSKLPDLNRWTLKLLSIVNKDYRTKEMTRFEMIDLMHTLAEFDRYCSLYYGERKKDRFYREYKEQLVNNELKR